MLGFDLEVDVAVTVLGLAECDLIMIVGIKKCLLLLIHDLLDEVLSHL